MLRKSLFALVVLTVSVIGFSVPASAQSQSVSFNLGYFTPRGEDARIANGDVLATNLNYFAFNLSDFNGATVGGEWLIGIGNNLEAGVGIAYYARTVPSVYRDFVNSDGTEIAQDLRLRIVPITASVRFLPLGRHGGFEPYIGAGLGIFAWRYSETGQFVDFTDNSIFRATYANSGTSAGPVILGGARIGVGNFAVGGELRYQKAEGTLSPDFFSNTIDLGGMTYKAIFQVRF